MNEGICYGNEAETQVRSSNIEIHKLRKSNAKLRDDYSRSLRRL